MTQESSGHLFATVGENHNSQLQIHRILAGSAEEVGRVWPVAQDVKHMSINGEYVEGRGPDFLSGGQITGFAW